MIQVSLQLPSDALFGFTNMIRQLRHLVEEVRGERPEREAVENSSFDEAHYQALYERSAAARSVRVDGFDWLEAEGALRSVQRQVPEARSAGGEQAASPERGEAGQDGAAPQQEPRQQPRDSEAHQAGREDGVEPAEDIPTVRSEAETPVAEAPQAGLEPESQIPEAEAVWSQMRESQIEAPSAASASSPSAPAEPRSAGFPLSNGSETVRSRWAGVTEELVSAGPAPLTAEAVSQAFRRDGRRYDNGFPLY